MNNHRTLLGLKGFVSAAGHQTFDHVVKRIVVVVVHDQFPAVINIYLHQDFFFSLN
jgi:hypothetical protein